MLFLNEFCYNSQAHDESEFKKLSAKQQNTEECWFPKNTLSKIRTPYKKKKKKISALLWVRNLMQSIKIINTSIYRG